MNKLIEETILTAGIILLFSLVIFSQTDNNIDLELLSNVKLNAPSKYDAKFFVRENNKTVSTYYNAEAKCLTSESTSNDSIILPQYLDVLVSDDGKTILQYGDRTTLFHPTVTDLIWINEQGKIYKEIENQFKSNALVKMSPDGYVAIYGAPIFKGSDILKIYNPKGEEMWSRTIESNRRVADLIISKFGRTISIITTDIENWLEDHRLEIIKQNGGDNISIANNGILQKMKFIGNQEDIFVQGYNQFFLAEQAFGEIKWKRNEKIRMVSPKGVEATENNQNILLAVVDLNKKRSGNYNWIIKTLDYNSGNNTGEFRLPNEHASTWDQVFKEILSDRFILETIDSQYTFRIN